MKTEYLIVGTGIAGLQAAKEIRKKDETGKILMVSMEHSLPYYRTKLTEAIATGESKEELLVEKEDFYQEKKIELLLEEKVVKIVPESKKIALESGKEIEYEKMLLDLGASPFIPPFEGGMKKNMFAIRTMEDLESLRETLPEVKTCLVVGGGLLGLEAAYSLLQKGLTVYVGEFADALLPRQLDKESSLKLEEDLKKEGLLVHTAGTLKEVVGDEKVEKVILTDGTSFDCQLVVFSVGVRSNLEPAKEVLETDRGIKGNRSLESSIEDIWVAGDCAEIEGATMGLWTAAMDMGRVAGRNMTGGEETYDLPSLFTNLKIGSISIFSIGSHDGEEWKQGEGDEFAKLFFKEDTIIGGILYGNIKKMGKLRKLLANKASKAESVEAFSA